MSWASSELAVESHLVVHVEQITGGAVCECAVEGCGDDAVLYITSEPDMDPGPVCATHGHGWIDLACKVLRDLYPPKDSR